MEPMRLEGEGKAGGRGHGWRARAWLANETIYLSAAVYLLKVMRFRRKGSLGTTPFVSIIIYSPRGA
jgi:hypothetical protein